jgi:flavin-dependent dehydrogenase
VIAPSTDAHTLRFDWIDELLPAYAWYFPGSASTVNFGLGMVARDRKKRRIDLKKLLERYNSILDPAGTSFSEARNVASYILPHGAKMPRLAHGNFILIGDAASMINPLSGEGIFYGMAAGEVVGSRIAAHKASDPVQRTLKRAEREIRKRFVAHFRSNYVASVLLRSRTWAAISIRASARDPRVVADAAELLFGEGRIRLRTTVLIIARGIRA